MQSFRVSPVLVLFALVSCGSPPPAASPASPASPAPVSTAIAPVLDAGPPEMTGAVYCHLLGQVADKILVDVRAAAAREGLTRDEARAAIMAATPLGARATVARIIVEGGYSAETVAAFVRDHGADAEHCATQMVDKLKEGEPALGRLVEMAREPVTPVKTLAWRSDVDSALHDARASKRPVLLRFKAAWVGADGELDRKTFADPAIEEDTRRFVLIEVDATDEDDRAVIALKTKYRVIGLPTIIVLDAKGAEATRILQYVDVATLRKTLAGVPGGSR